MKLLQRYLSATLVTMVLFSNLALCAQAVNSPKASMDNGALEDATQMLQGQETYLVGYTPDYSPFSYEGSTGAAAGMAITMMDYIAELAGIQVEYVSLEDDIPVDVSLSILNQDQRTENSTRSSPYFNLQMMLTGQSSDFPTEGDTIGHLNYSAIDDGMVEDAIPGATAYTYSSYDELATALEDGELDYILTSSLVVLQTSSLSQSLGTYSHNTSMTLDFMLKYNDSMSQETMEAFNTVISYLDSDEAYSRVIDAVVLAVAADEEVTVMGFLSQHRYIIMLIIAAVIIVLVLIFLYFSVKGRRILLKNLNEDDLTGLMSERRFIEYVSAKLKKDKSTRPYYIISIDIDNFKYINENYGYEKGTETIVAFAKMLGTSFEGMECAARSFADNFLILTQVTPRENHICGRDNCRKCMDSCLTHVLGGDYKMMTSAGIYRIDDPTLDLSYMIDCANIARRRGKDAYARTEIIFTAQIEEDIKTKNDIIASMEQALEQREFKMHYQPKLDFKTLEIIGAEALVRWYTPNGHQVYPSQFIYLFEQNGFISRLDFYVLNEVCQFLDTHPDMPRISVNMSGYSFLDPQMVAVILGIVERNHVDPSRIEFEITESAIVNEFDIIVKKIDELRANGFTVSMDDFGAGMSSLNRLKDIPIDVLKIDREFLGVENLSDKGISIIDSIIQMSHRIDITTVAEGVETPEQVKLLTHLNCNVAQGYYYSRPLKEEDFIAYVNRQKEPIGKEA